MFQFGIVILMLSLFSVSSGWTITIHVPEDYITIQAGIDVAVDSDTVLVADGTYTGSGNKDLDYSGKALTVMSENGPELTIIDCENDGRGLYFHSGEDALSRLEGFTIQNGYERYGGGMYLYDSSPTITNCIFWGDTPNEGSGVGPGNATITYSDIQGSWKGEGNIDADPLFADPANDDYHLTILSPCIDSGTDAGVYDDINGEIRPYGAGFDMGADEYYPSEGLEVFLLDHPDSIGLNETLSFEAGVYNSGSGNAALDEALLSVTGPAPIGRTLYSGPPLSIAAGDNVSKSVQLYIPDDAPLGWYILTVEIFLEGERLSSAAFYVEVVEG